MSIGEEEEELIKAWFGEKVNFKLLYRGSNDGFTYKQ